jgi:hypothetical protein
LPDKFFNLPTINDGFLKLQKQIIIPMKHSIVFLIQLLMLTAISCKAQTNNSAQNLNSLEGTYLELQKFQREPDSLLTENEKIKKQTSFNLIKEKVSVKNNQFYSSATAKILRTKAFQNTITTYWKYQFVKQTNGQKMKTYPTSIRCTKVLLKMLS